MRIPDDTKQYPHAELTREVIGAAIEVQRSLKLGLDEKIYETALCIELAERGISFSQQPEYPIHYKGKFIGKLRPDLVIENSIIVEAKVAENFSQQHYSQLLGYLAITELELGLLLNFKTIPLGIKRLVK